MENDLIDASEITTAGRWLLNEFRLKGSFSLNEAEAALKGEPSELFDCHGYGGGPPRGVALLCAFNQLNEYGWLEMADTWDKPAADEFTPDADVRLTEDGRKFCEFRLVPEFQADLVLVDSHGEAAT